MKPFAWLALILAVVLAVRVASSGPIEDALAAIDPHGRPKSVQSGKRTEYGLWYENGEWHIRATGQSGKKQRFRGYVRVEGGTIAEGKFNHLEMVAKKTQNSDWVVLNPDKDGFQFLFRTTGRLDAIDFKLSDSAQKVEFSLLIESDTSPKNIKIGAKQVHPPKNPFSLPAKPEAAKPEVTQLEAKKDAEKKAND